MNRNILTDFSALFIIGTNMVPLGGVLFFHWSLFEVVLTYWAETIIVFFYTHLKLLKLKGPLHLLAIPFSCFFWYGFITIHLFLICGLFGPHGIKFNHHGLWMSFWPGNLLDYISWDMLTAIFCLFLSHGAEFILNFLGKKQYLADSAKDIQNNFVYRIMIMQFTLIIGGWLILLFKAPVWGLAVLVMIKITADLHAYNKHQNLFYA